MTLDNCNEAQLIREGGRDRATIGTPRPDLDRLPAIEQAAYLKGFDALDGYENLLCPCLAMTRDACAGECAKQDSVALQRSYYQAH